jgi:hypothetical protein
VPVQIEEAAIVSEFTLRADESASFVVEEVLPGRELRGGGTDYVADAFKRTVNFWRAWLARSHYHGRWREMVDRSALTLKLLTSRRYGSIIAAPTFGLPEEVGGERNWDYRYTWIRDASFTLYGLMRLGFVDEAAAFMRWIEARCAEIGPEGTLQIMYGIDGRHDLGEETLPHLEGYMRSAPVRIGNAAYRDLQLDIYGELMDSVYLFDKYGSPISYDLWNDLSRAIEWVADHWRQKDAAIWEVRGGPQEFLYSRVQCWVALDRALRLAGKRSFPAPIERWRAVRDEIQGDIFANFWNQDRQAFVQAKGSNALDAAALLMPLIRFIGPTDPRWVSTLAAIEQNLVSDSLVYRYRIGEAVPDGLAGREGTFSMCHPPGADQCGVRPRPAPLRARRSPSLGLAEEARPVRVAEGEVRSAELVVRDARRILCDARQRALASRVRFRPRRQEDVGHPVVHRMDHAVVVVVRAGKSVRRSVPIVVCDQLVAQHADVAQGERQPLAEGRVARCGGIAQQHDTVTVRVVDPGVGGGEARQAADGARPRVDLRADAGSHRLFDETRHVGRSPEAMLALVLTDEIGARPTVALGEQIRGLSEDRVEDQVARVRRNRQVGEEDTGDQQARRRIPDGEAGPASHHGRSTVCSGDQTCRQDLGTAVLVNLDARRRARLHAPDGGAAPHLGARRGRRMQQDLLHRRVIETQGGEPLWRRLHQVASTDWHAADVRVPPGQGMTAGLEEEVMQPEGARFVGAPRSEPFAAHPIRELALPLEHQDPRAACGHRPRQRGATQATADRDDVVVGLHVRWRDT